MDVELFGVKGRVAFHDDSAANHLLEFAEPLSIVRLECLDDFRMDPEKNVTALKVLLHLAQLSVDLVADGDRTFDHARAGADLALGAEGTFKGLLHALAGDRNQAKVVELEDLGRSTIGLECFLKSGHDPVPVLALIHIDEVDDDDAAKIAQTDLADDLRDRIKVGLDDGVFESRCLADILCRC